MTITKHFIVPAFLGLLFITSCENENTVTEEVADTNEIDTSDRIILGVNTSEIPSNLDQKTLDLISKNHLSPLGAQLEEMVLPGGEKREVIRVEGDIVMFPEDLEKMNFDGYESIHQKQYSTNALVSPRTINVIGYTGGSQALTSSERTALQWAVNNYNRLNLNINFNLTFGTSYQNKDMVVYNNTVNNPSGAGGSAGFPSNGRPFKFVQIYGLSNYNTNVIEHVITHEIGHSVGFRHTDYFSRQSCGQNTNEGTAGVGANYIPGTPSGYDSTSIMLACFSNNEDGEFNSNDITALNFLY
ncbi:zinc-dependent metalloprotease [Psychroflexus sp. CAK8W]|uniref:Zinc-dependent metalloprotease n=1 Tax=Psychroflexus longus TaxID=2873596 RepID=A0ABS7XIV9_9FLAO|nr:zinc-dependent metalloprotease [Psychroflexus longus]MBZ9777831.1 zinc-dependent metalloprotease [Psychroflexus longus]